MPDELHTLACVLGELQLAYHPGEDAGVVWVLKVMTPRLKWFLIE
jgi:hypothetical protein